MIFKKFRFVTIFRILIIMGLIGLLFFLIFKGHVAISIVTGMIIIQQVISLIQYIEQTNRDLTRFFSSVQFEDYSQSFSQTGFGASFDELKNAMNDIIEKFKKTRAEKEAHYRYLQIVVEHIGVGLLVFDELGEVLLINKAAKRLLGLPFLKNLHELKKINDDFVHVLQRLKPGDKTLHKLHSLDLQLNLYATEFILREHPYKLVSLQNIQSELEEKEMEAWQNLIRVLTHEINNSVTPIASLASTANDLLSKSSRISSDHLTDIQSAVQTIQKRSEGLLNFVESYRKLTKLPKPDFQIFPVQELFKRVFTLMENQINKHHIQWSMAFDPESLEVTADPEMIEQVLINLVLNSIQALKDKKDGKILLSAFMDRKGRVTVQVQDNGRGILDEVQERIFIPFFTTKKEGSGIGLSLSRQIMRLHRGSITVKSIFDKETVFTLKF